MTATLGASSVPSCLKSVSGRNINEIEHISRYLRCFLLTTLRQIEVGNMIFTHNMDLMKRLLFIVIEEAPFLFVLISK